MLALERGPELQSRKGWISWNISRCRGMTQGRLSSKHSPKIHTIPREFDQAGPTFHSLARTRQVSPWSEKRSDNKPLEGYLGYAQARMQTADFEPARSTVDLIGGIS
jgi:hypothetical protein